LDTTDVSKDIENELTVADTPSASATVETWLGDVLAARQVEKEGVKTISKHGTVASYDSSTGFFGS
jgi:hypothetical protein